MKKWFTPEVKELSVSLEVTAYSGTDIDLI